MLIDGWNIDINNLEGPHLQKWKYKFDHFLYQSNEEHDLACLIYDIAEIAMGWDVGLLAVFSEKMNPELLLNPKNFLCFYTKDTVQFNSSGSIVFIKKYVASGANNLRVELPFCVIDFKSNNFSYINLVNSIPYSVFELETRHFRLDEHYTDTRFESFNGRVIDIDTLKWFDIEDLEKFDEIYLDESH